MATRAILVPSGGGTQAKERRAGGPKVRTGCITCKIRRVKCDKTKPACRRCTKFGITCDGYASKKPPTAFRTLPRDEALMQPIAPKGTIPNTILRTPRRNPFANDLEYRYFQLFCERTANNLAGYFRGSLWNRMILQACEGIPAVRHAIIALGALDKTLDITQHTDVSGSANLQVKAIESSAHHRFALQQYGKAIAQMRSSISTRRQDYRAALILCLLTICFEALNGDMQSALEQIRNGLKLIKEWRTAMAASTLGSRSKSKTQSLGSDELIRAFGFLDNNSIMIMNAVPVMGADVEDSAQDIPECFHSLEDARDHFEFLVSRMLHWIASAYAWGAGENDEAKRRVQLSPMSQGAVMKPTDFRRGLTEQRQRFLEEFRNWRNAFQPLWRESQSISGSKNFMTAVALEMRFKSLFISLLGNHFIGDGVYDALTAHFREVVDLAKIFVKNEKLQNDSQRASFTFDDPFIGSVYFVILKCRDQSLRREAIAILQSHPRRDGVMDSVLMAKIGTVQMNIEEAESEGNYIPEHARIRGIKTTTNMANRTGRMKFLKMASSTNREFVVHHLNFTW